MISQHPDAPGRRLSISLKYTGPQSKEEGEKLFKDANKKRLAFQGCRIFRLCSREKTDDDRAESIRKYLRAAHHFMNANEWEKAGESYENCARLQEMGNEMETIDAAGSYASAALCYKQDKCIKEKNGQQPTNRSNRSVSTVMERIRLPSIDESKLNPIDTSLSRLAHMQMDYKNYEKAKANFEKLAVGLYTDESNEDHADNFFFKAAMCALAHNPELALESVKRYFEMRPNLQETQQFALWFELFRSLHSKDQEQFSQLIDDNREAKIWVQKIIADLCNQLHFTDMEEQIQTRSRRQSVQGLKNDPFYTLYNYHFTLGDEEKLDWLYYQESTPTPPTNHRVRKSVSSSGSKSKRSRGDVLVPV